MDGRLTAHGGSITLINESDNSLGASRNFDAYGQGRALLLWIGANAAVDVSGAAYTATDTTGRTYGTVTDGGSINLGGATGFVIVRPGAEGFSQASLLALASVGFCAVRDLATRRIPKHLPTVFITLLTTVTVTTAGAAVLVPLGGWRPPSGHALGLLVLAAMLILIGYQCIIVSLRTGDISAVAPLRYTALPWAMLTGYLAFGHKPDGAILAGAAIIVASGLYAFYRERMRDKLRPAATGPGLPPDGL